MRVMVLDHQGKSFAIADGLRARGCELVSDPTLADVILIDHDVPSHGKIQQAAHCLETGGRAFLYPHGVGAGMMAPWDGLFDVSPLISGVFAPGPGHAEVARRYGYPHPVHDVGWTLCELRPRRAPHPVRNILFAAQHPKGDGHLSDWKLARNRDIFDRLLATPAKLTVRYLHELEANGIPRVDGVEYTRGELDGFAGMLAQIDAADVVVSDRSTFSSLAIARGVSTVMFDSTVVAKDLDRSHETDHIELYREYMRFPFEAEDGVDIWELMQAAAQDSELVGEWRARFVGGPFDVDAMFDALVGDGAHLAPDVRAARLHRVALTWLERSDHVGAARLLSEAIVTSVDLELLNDLAVIWWNQGREDDARALLRACVALDPGYASAAGNLESIEAAAV